jgi:hypothetical protein
VRIILDLAKLVSEGKLTPAQAAELTQLAARDTGLLAINILMVFGTVAVAGGVMLLVPSLPTAAAISLLLVGGGLVLSYSLGPQWAVLSSAAFIVGALWLCATAITYAEGNWTGFLFAAAALIAGAVTIRSGVLSALAAVALAAALGGSAAYETATYILVIREPTATIACFGLLAWISYLLANRVAAQYESLALMFARMSLILVNFGFWVGSLWGDTPASGWLPPGSPTPPHFTDIGFAAVWAIGLVAVGAWAAHVNRRFVVNVAATFLAIDFYTQYFERLGADPLTIALGGVLVIGVAVALWRFNAAFRPAKASG